MSHFSYHTLPGEWPRVVQYFSDSRVHCVIDTFESNRLSDKNGYAATVTGRIYRALKAGVHQALHWLTIRSIPQWLKAKDTLTV